MKSSCVQSLGRHVLAALAEHLAARHDLAPPEWAETRVLRRPWFPAELEIQRADAWYGHQRLELFPVRREDVSPLRRRIWGLRHNLTLTTPGTDSSRPA